MDQQEPVIIVGAGPVGLGASLELARFGVRSILIEKHPSTSWHPKTRNINTRTMEIIRGWGPLVYQRVRSIDTPPGWKSPILFLDTATGNEFGRIETLGFVGPGPDISPAEPVMSSQELLEEILVDAARATGLVDIRFSTEVTSIERDGSTGDVDRPNPGTDDGVAITVLDHETGTTQRLTGAALVAADGAASFVRDAIGVELVGRKDLANFVNCYFTSDIEPLLGDRSGVLLFVTSEAADGVLQPLDAAGRWLCQIMVTTEESTRDQFSDDRVRDWVRAAVGVADLDVELRSVGFWQLNATVAERFVHGRTIIVGDAAHQFPPTGGLGVNTGLQGMHNAMWKLAWFVKGLADWSLVETYDPERKDLSKKITEQSLQNSANVGRIRRAMRAGGLDQLDRDDLIRDTRRYGNHLGAEFGAVYDSAAIISDGTVAPEVEDDFSDYEPSATPGARAPHHWLGQGEDRLSTIDLVGNGVTLLAGPAGEAWVEAARTLSAEPGVPVDAYRVGAAGLADEDDLPARFGIGPAGAVLIRPDGHVVWRSAEVANGDAVMTLRSVIDRLATAAN